MTPGDIVTRRGAYGVVLAVRGPEVDLVPVSRSWGPRHRADVTLPEGPWPLTVAHCNLPLRILAAGQQRIGAVPTEALALVRRAIAREIAVRQFEDAHAVDPELTA